MTSSSASPAGASLPLGATVTIFFSDLRGFTEYTEQHGDAAAFRVLQHHNAIVRRQVELFGGHVVKTQGDSFMVTFGTARAAIQCAVAVQRALESASHDEPQGIALGIGINTGEPIQEGGDFFGSPVNLAARICAKAGPGQILVSETTRSVAGRIEAADFVDRGSHDLKGFQEPQRLYEVRWNTAEPRTGAPGQNLRSELTALAEQCGHLGQELVRASRAMQTAGALPAGTLGPRITALRSAFRDLRGRLLQRAGPAGVEVPPQPESLVAVGDLEPLLAAIVEAEAGRAAAPRRAPTEDEHARQAAFEEAVQHGLGVLNRVLALTHRDDPASQPLLECQARATELQVKLSRMLSTARDHPAERVQEAIGPFADLITLIRGHENIDDERWMRLEENAARVFGRPLIIAATRGRLLLEGAEARPARSATPAPAPAPRPGPPRSEPPRAEPARPEPVRAEPARADPPRAEPAPAEPARPKPAARPRAPEPVPAAAAAPKPDPRGAAVAWWTTAHTAWIAWKTSGLATAHALRAALSKHPYVLSVPIQDASEYDEGSLAGSYFFLLEHVETQSPAFIRTAVEQALQVGGTREPTELGRVLYDLLVSRGRLRETYPDFVRDVMVAGIPTPGIWRDAAIIEDADATIIVTRPSEAIGDAAETARRLTDPKARLAEHRFTVAVSPLSTRFVCLRRGNVKDGRDVDVRLTENGAPTDSAWLLTLRSDHLSQTPPRRPERTGTTLAGFGLTYNHLWVGCFNTEPQGDKLFEVIFKMRPAGQAAALRRSVFGARPR
jgi:class 3 adenylate cyclase